MLKDIHAHSLPCSAPEEVLLSYSVQQGDIPTKAVYISVEVHPWHLTPENIPLFLMGTKKLLSDSRVLALGEVGLDKLAGCPFPLQMEAFEEVSRMSEMYSKPLIIHCVKSIDELIAMKKRMRPSQPWIIHGFRGKWQQADSFLRHGFFLSFGEHFQSQVISGMPIERLFLETDESKIPIDELYNKVAAIRGISSEELKQAVARNVYNVFGIL